MTHSNRIIKSTEAAETHTFHETTVVSALYTHQASKMLEVSHATWAMTSVEEEQTCTQQSKVKI